MADWLKLGAGEMGRRIAAGKINPAELLQAHLDAIEAHPEAGRIYARTTPDRARAEALAASARAKAGHRLGPLDGVPISWKDNFDSAGTLTEAGSALLKGRTPDTDAKVLRNATAQGLVCLGKTHLSELAFSGLGLNPITATPPAINDPKAVPGGSSSGAAASVAFGLAAAGIGSDTGGSVRIPAAWNDLVGLKTTAGLLPLVGVVPLIESLDTVGPLARSVEDAALLFGALQGARAPDLAGATLEGCRFLVLETAALDDLREAPAMAFGAACGRLEKGGATLARGKVPEVAEALTLAAMLYTTEAYGRWRDVIETAPDRMFRPILERFRAGADVRGADFVSAWIRLRVLREAYNAATAAYDAVILPTTATLPPNAERLLADVDYYLTENRLALRNTTIGNLMGVSALTLPTGTPSCGLMLMGPPMTEARLLRLGAAAEAALA